MLSGARICTAVRRIATLIASLMPRRRGDESHPKPWSQAEKSQAKGERQGGKNRKSALAFDMPGARDQRRADHGADGRRGIKHAQAAGPDAINRVGEDGNIGR